jgi:branched-chain amino acid transport system permease protein
VERRALGCLGARTRSCSSSPLVFTSGFAQTLFSQVGIAIIACLSYNILLGQGGMLSFGHAVLQRARRLPRDPTC